MFLSNHITVNTDSAATYNTIYLNIAKYNLGAITSRIVNNTTCMYPDNDDKVILKTFTEYNFAGGVFSLSAPCFSLPDTGYLSDAFLNYIDVFNIAISSSTAGLNWMNTTVQEGDNGYDDVVLANTDNYKTTYNDKFGSQLNFTINSNLKILPAFLIDAETGKVVGNKIMRSTDIKSLLKTFTGILSHIYIFKYKLIFKKYNSFIRYGSATFDKAFAYYIGEKEYRSSIYSGRSAIGYTPIANYTITTRSSNMYIDKIDSSEAYDSIDELTNLSDFLSSTVFIYNDGQLHSDSPTFDLASNTGSNGIFKLFKDVKYEPYENLDTIVDEVCNIIGLNKGNIISYFDIFGAIDYIFLFWLKNIKVLTCTIYACHSNCHADIRRKIKITIYYKKFSTKSTTKKKNSVSTTTTVTVHPDVTKPSKYSKYTFVATTGTDLLTTLKTLGGHTESNPKIIYYLNKSVIKDLKFAQQGGSDSKKFTMTNTVDGTNILIFCNDGSNMQNINGGYFLFMPGTVTCDGETLTVVVSESGNQGDICMSIHFVLGAGGKYNDSSDMTNTFDIVIALDFNRYITDSLTSYAITLEGLLERALEEQSEEDYDSSKFSKTSASKLYQFDYFKYKYLKQDNTTTALTRVDEYTTINIADFKDYDPAWIANYYSNTSDMNLSLSCEVAWKELTITIIFVKGNGTSNEYKTVKYNESMPSITVPTFTNCTFNGYYTLEGGGGTLYYDSSGTRLVAKNTSTTDFTLYASWTVNVPTPPQQKKAEKVKILEAK